MIKATAKKLAFLGLVILAGYGFISSAIADPCADVKAGNVEFMNSPSCIDECAVDGVNCPYTPGANMAAPPSAPVSDAPAATMATVPDTTAPTTATAPYISSTPAPEDAPQKSNSYIVREEGTPESRDSIYGH